MIFANREIFWHFLWIFVIKVISKANNEKIKQQFDALNTESPE